MVRLNWLPVKLKLPMEVNLKFAALLLWSPVASRNMSLLAMKPKAPPVTRYCGPTSKKAFVDLKEYAAVVKTLRSPVVYSPRSPVTKVS